jgi:altronate dehydratase small subunit
MKQKEQFVYRVTDQDNVATALEDLTAGTVVINGAGEKRTVECLEDVASGHKIALTSIKKGTPIIKYGTVIGEAIADITEGSWVHLQNMKSLYDERSSTLDIHTGAPSDTLYI